MATEWLTIARLANAQWLAVSIFEHVIRLPERLAREPGVGVFGGGSPARYHVPMAPFVLGSAAVAAAAAEPRPFRGWAGAGAGLTGAAAALTGFLIATVNVPLLEGSALPGQRAALTARWHRVNGVRLVLLAGAGIAFHMAARSGSGGTTASVSGTSERSGHSQT